MSREQFLTLFAGLVFFRLLRFKSVSIPSCRIVCVWTRFGPVNELSEVLGLMKGGFLLKCIL